MPKRHPGDGRKPPPPLRRPRGGGWFCCRAGDVAATTLVPDHLTPRAAATSPGGAARVAPSPAPPDGGAIDAPAAVAAAAGCGQLALQRVRSPPCLPSDLPPVPPPLPPPRPPADGCTTPQQQQQERSEEGSRSRSSTPSVSGHTVTVNNTTTITVYNNYNMAQQQSPERQRCDDPAAAATPDAVVKRAADPGARYRVRHVRRPSAGHTGGDVEDLDDSCTTTLPPKSEARQLGEVNESPRKPSALPGLNAKPRRRTNIIPDAPPGWATGKITKQAGLQSGVQQQQARNGVDCLLSSFGIASLRSASPAPDCSVPGTVVVFEQRKQERAADWG